MRKPKEAVYQCPCCDYFSLSARDVWEICYACFWEDDSARDGHALDIDELDVVSGNNNGLTLRQARANFIAIGACEPLMLKHVCSKEDREKYRYEAREMK